MEVLSRTLTKQKDRDIEEEAPVDKQGTRVERQNIFQAHAQFGAAPQATGVVQPVCTFYVVMP